MIVSLALPVLLATSDHLVFEGSYGPGKGTHIVFLAGDEEYRSEEGLPQLAKILAVRHGFKCTVLFSLNAKGEIDPDEQRNQPGTEALNHADLCVLLLRFRNWPDEQMKPFADYVAAGRPLIALRTSTHAFAYPTDSASPYRKFGWQSKEWAGGFGRHILGETWISHWGDHGVQATRGLPEPSSAGHPILKGVETVFGDSDVYEASPPADARVLLRGQVLSGMSPDSPPATGRRKTAAGGEQELNDPMMPVAWVRGRILTCTMGAATDLLDEGLRRFLVNGAYWAVGLEERLPAKADVRLVGEYLPSKFGFGTYRRGVKPLDLEVE